MESLKWVLEHKEDMCKADHSVMAEPLTNCLIDKDSKVRKEAEKVILLVMPFTGYEPFNRTVMKFKPAQQQDVKKILEKAKKESGPAAAPVAVTQEEAKIPDAKKVGTKKADAKPVGPTPKANAPPPQNPTRVVE